MSELTEILDADISAGDLQMFPEVYTHRRFLLEHIRQRDEDVKELATLMGLDGSLSDIIVTVRQRLASAQAESVQRETVERELHSPFHEAAVPEPAPATWPCGCGLRHLLGDPCPDGCKRNDKSRCPHDGGFCHHQCTTECFRMKVSARLSTPWKGFPKPGRAPVRVLE